MSLLSRTIRQSDNKPVRMVLTGWTGAGKSSFAAAAPKPYFVAAEDGLVNLDVPRFAPESFGEVRDLVKELTDDPHDYQSLVVDSLDWLEMLLHKEIANQAGVEAIADVDYGKLYEKIPGRWREFLVSLERLQSKRGMHVILICHRQDKEVKNPEGLDYLRADLKLLSSKSVKTGELVREWADIVGMAANEQTVSKEDGKVKGAKSFWLYTGTNPARVTKSRYSIPDKLPLEWPKFERAIQDAKPRTLDDAMKELKALSAPADLLDKAGTDVVKLNRLLVWLKEKNK